MKNDVDMSVYLEDNDRYADLVNVFGKLTKRKVSAVDVKLYVQYYQKAALYTIGKKE